MVYGLYSIKKIFKSSLLTYSAIGLSILCIIYIIYSLTQFRQVKTNAADTYVICMPEGGLCDMMARIHDCIEYCKQHGRTMILDTRHATHATDLMETYFTIYSPVLYKGDLDAKYASLKGKSFYPDELHDTFSTMDVKWTKEHSIIDVKTKVPTYFDLTRAYSEDVLLFRDCGGGARKVMGFLSLSRLTPLVKEVYEKRRASLPEKYISVHVRNTDRKSDVGGFIERNSKVFEANPIFLATDDHASIDLFKQTYGANLYTFSKPDPAGGEIGNHHVKRSKEETRVLTIDAIVDILLLANGTSLYYSHPDSGFSKVAKALNKDPHVLKNLIG